MENKYRFWQLLDSEQFSKIEIPILQRDYAQGRNTPEVKTIRRTFSSHLVNALCTNKPIELDFVYGSVERDKVFIPLDGQQRLTTLFLLHWYVATKEGKINDTVKEKLKKFSYETRPSAHNFCKELIDKCQYTNDLSDFIRDSVWYNDEWNNDPTVIGMLTMLETFQKNEQLNQKYDFSLFDRLTNEEVITFYFIKLEKYGLTEDLYIRMNARGKLLNDFENFKSEFCKIISYDKKLFDKFKDKVEYAWVSGLWDFRDKDKFIVDKAFMNYLHFITEMLYFKQSTVRADSYEKFGKTELTNFEVLKNVFSNKENLDFLIFALDKISFFRSIKREMFWEQDRNTLAKIIEQLINGHSTDVTSQIIFYSTLRYFYIIETETVDENYFDFIRVIRNLTHNTNDKSRREWAKLFSSIEQLMNDIKHNNIYVFLSGQTGKNILDGFYVPQREEEVLKAKLIMEFSDSKSILFEAEENEHFRGSIQCLLKATFTQPNNVIIDSKNIDTSLFDKTYLDKLKCLLEKYMEISKDDFVSIWGDLIITQIYNETYWRIEWIDDYAKHNAMMQFLLDYYHSNLQLEDYVISIEKSFIQNKNAEHNGQLIEITNYKERLYVYYILTRRIMDLPYQEFFRNGCNFGWLDKEKGFKSIFDKEKGFKSIFNNEKPNPIFQTYTYQFRYSFGLKPHNALPPEIEGNNRPQNPFEKLINWAK